MIHVNACQSVIAVWGIKAPPPHFFFHRYKNSFYLLPTLLYHSAKVRFSPSDQQAVEQS